MSATTITDGVEGLAAKIGVFYRDGKINLGAPLYAFTPAELAEFARRLRPQVDEAMALARGAWRAGITLGNNICVQESDRENDQDGDSGWINGTAECAKRIREWVEPDDAQLLELLAEAGVDVSSLTAAMNPESDRG